MYSRPAAAPSPRPARPLTAWQRWEMGSFPSPVVDELEVPPPTPAEAPLEPLVPIHVPVIDEAELQRLRHEARQAGEAEGRLQGHAQGRTEGHAAGLAEAREQAAKLLALALSLPAAISCAEAEIADSLLALALDLGRQLAGAALQADPAIILAVVRELLVAEPALSGSPRLLLHADDAALVREHLAEEMETAGWTLQVDAAITRGGCAVKAGSGEFDATIETRRQRVEAALACRTRPPGPANA
jgi:flagellar assembly protein FliH